MLDKSPDVSEWTRGADEREREGENWQVDSEKGQPHLERWGLPVSGFGFTVALHKKP